MEIIPSISNNGDNTEPPLSGVDKGGSFMWPTYRTERKKGRYYEKGTNAGFNHHPLSVHSGNHPCL